MIFRRPLGREDRRGRKPDVFAVGRVEKSFPNPVIRRRSQAVAPIFFVFLLPQLRDSLPQIPPPELGLPGFPAHEVVVFSGGFVDEGFGGHGGEVGGGCFGGMAFFSAGEYVSGWREDAFYVVGEGLFRLDEARDFDEFGRLRGNLSMGGGGCAEVGWFGVIDTLADSVGALSIYKSRRHDGLER